MSEGVLLMQIAAGVLLPTAVMYALESRVRIAFLHAVFLPSKADLKQVHGNGAGTANGSDGCTAGSRRASAEQPPRSFGEAGGSSTRGGGSGGLAVGLRHRAAISDFVSEWLDVIPAGSSSDTSAPK